LRKYPGGRADCQGNWITTFPARAPSIQCSFNERASIQSPLKIWRATAVRWAWPMVNGCCVGSVFQRTRDLPPELECAA
jgi:hypothetical protein